MAMIIKKDTGIVKCAANNKREEGDLYINDALHYNLAMFLGEFAEEAQTVLERNSVKIEEVDKDIRGYHTLDEIRQGVMKRVYGGRRCFGSTLCREMHENGLTFDTLAAKWEISLPLLAALVADHCYKLTAGIFSHAVDDEVHTVEEYHSRFDHDGRKFNWQKEA